MIMITYNNIIIMLYAKLVSVSVDSVIFLSFYNIAALCLLIGMLCTPPCTFHTECTDMHAWNRVIVHVFKIIFLLVRTFNRQPCTDRHIMFEYCMSVRFFLYTSFRHRTIRKVNNNSYRHIIYN